MSNQSQMQQQQEALRKDVFTVLKKFPDGIPKDQIWQYVLKYTRRHVSARKYGFSKMSNILVCWPEIETVQEEGKPAVFRLKEEGVFDKYLDSVFSEDWTSSYSLPGPKVAPPQQQPLSNITLNTSSFMTGQSVKSKTPIMASPEINASLRMNLPPSAGMASATGVSEKQKRQLCLRSPQSVLDDDYLTSDDETEPQDHGGNLQNANVLAQIPGAAGTSTLLGQTDVDFWWGQTATNSLLGQTSTNSLSRKQMCSQTMQPAIYLPPSIQVPVKQPPLHLHFPLLMHPDATVKNPAMASPVVLENATLSKECRESTKAMSSQERNVARDSDVITCHESRKFWGISWPVGISENVFKDNLADILKQCPEGLTQNQLIKRYKLRYNFEIIPDG